MEILKTFPGFVLKIRVHPSSSVVKFPPHQMSTDSIISKVCGFRTILGDDGNGDYLAQMECLTA